VLIVIVINFLLAKKYVYKNARSGGSDEISKGHNFPD
jgi:hypothetical protein